LIKSIAYKEFHNLPNVLAYLFQPDIFVYKVKENKIMQPHFYPLKRVNHFSETVFLSNLNRVSLVSLGGVFDARADVLTGTLTLRKLYFII
jgi:hypothetical protein